MCAGKIKSESYYIARKCHWLPLHPQRPRRHYYTGQISHYKDEWVHKNTITYHSACRIPNELLTGPLIRAIGGEGTEARVPALKKILVVSQDSLWHIFSRTHERPSTWAHAGTHRHIQTYHHHTLHIIHHCENAQHSPSRWACPIYPAVHGAIHYSKA